VDELLAISRSVITFKQYFFVDFGCAAPYVDIDSSKYDALYFSGHKFAGGISTPGILVGRKCLFMHSIPYNCGGGCVKAIKNDDNVIYHDDLEARESAGTPNIIGIIKLKKVFELKEYYKNYIKHNEEALLHLMYAKIKYFKRKYKNFEPIFYHSYSRRLPILSFNIKKLHHSKVVSLLSNNYGIQCRGGISCAGLLGNYLKQKKNIDGWVRISFHWSMMIEDISMIYFGIEDLLKSSEMYLD